MTQPEVPVSPRPQGNDETFFAVRSLTEDAEGRGLRRSLFTAFAAHAVFLAVTIPGLVSQEVVAETPPHKVFVVRQLIFKPPPPKPPEKPIQHAVRKPVPDPTPDDPEPLPVEEVELEPEPPQYDDVIGIPEAPPEPEPDLDKPIEVGGEVKAPVRERYVEPKYTELARRAHIQGMVILETIVDRNGDVTQVKVLKGQSMGLTESAIDAVKQWKFKPATLRGKPVDVIFRLTVRFQVS